MTFDTSFQSGGAFVLAGSGGLGGAICEAFARAGVSVALSYFTNRAAAETVAARVRAHGVVANIYQVDATDRSSLKAALADAASAFDGLHSIIYASGPKFTPQFFSITDQTVWRDWLDGDVMAALNLAQLAIPHLRMTRGAFTAISTYQGERVEVRGAPSAIAKAAVDRMVKVIAKEEGRYGVRANTIRCGWIRSATVDALYRASPDLREEKTRSIPLQRLGDPDEIGETVVFLSSLRAGFITGVNLVADGGESL